MGTSGFCAPREFYVSQSQVMRVINLIQDSLPNFDLPKSDKHHTDVIKIRVSDDDFGDNFAEDLLACHFILDFFKRIKGFKDKYYIWVETIDSDKYPEFKQKIESMVSVSVGESNVLGRIRFGQVLSICVRLKSSMFERIKYNMEMGTIMYN